MALLCIQSMIIITACAAIVIGEIALLREKK